MTSATEILVTATNSARILADVCRLRIQQIERGYSHAHDDGLSEGELVAMALAIAGGAHLSKTQCEDLWPYEPGSIPIRKDFRTDLMKAISLLVAEIERLDRSGSQALPPPR